MGPANFFHLFFDKVTTFHLEKGNTHRGKRLENLRPIKDNNITHLGDTPEYTAAKSGNTLTEILS